MRLREYTKLFGSSLVPDFQQFYSLRYTEVLRTWTDREVLLLIAGLPEESRFFARLIGEPRGKSWSSTEWLLFDIRNIAEARRVVDINAHSKKKTKFTEYRNYPGHEAAKRHQATRTMSAWREKLSGEKFREIN